jgi:Na+/melibiose symporter-like transporter
MIGYVGGAVPTEKVVSGISTIMIYTPTITTILAAVIFYLGYRIGEQDITRMQEELAAK